MPTKKTKKKAPAKRVVRKTTKKATKKVARKTVAKKVTRKTTAKKAVKKSPKKVSIKKTTVRKRNKKLVLSGDSTSFWVTNGQILNSLVALRDALDAMEKEVYQYHAGGAQNDFANWVEAVLADAACAKELEKAKTPRSAKTIVVRHLKTYSV